ncbi:MAG: SGNH/GDSL hydrolase family protein [Acidobacteriota bacterium]
MMTKRGRNSVIPAVLLGALLVGGSTPALWAQSSQWIGTWASAPQVPEPRNVPPPPGVANSTLRQVVHVSVGGDELRVRFSNGFGRTPLTIAAARLARSAGGSAIDPASDHALTFAGRPSVMIPPGALMLSDPIRFELAPLSDVVVSIYVTQAPEDVTSHPGSRTTSYLQSGERVSAVDMPEATKFEHWYILSGIDVRSTGSGASVAILGDSITDGRGSTTNENRRWPDFLARRLQANPDSRKIGVLNQGIGGNRVLNDGLGPNVLARLDRDVLAQSGVRWLIVFEGVNDIGTFAGKAETGQVPATAENLIAAFEQIIERARAHGIRVYGATILPFEGSFYFTPEREAERRKVNDWIRNSGRFDAVLDFDAVAGDADRPGFLATRVDCGDHLHLNDDGYRTLAESIDLSLFSR